MTTTIAGAVGCVAFGLVGPGAGSAPDPDGWWNRDVREVVDFAEWRELRAMLDGRWRRDAPGNAALVRAFLGDGTDDRRVRAATAYLAGGAFRLGRIRHPEVVRLLAEVRAMAEARTRHLVGVVVA